MVSRSIVTVSYRSCGDGVRSVIRNNGLGINNAEMCHTGRSEGNVVGVLEKGQCLGGNIQYCGDYKNTRYSVPDIDHKYYYEYDVKSSKYYQVPIYAFPFIFGTISNVILLIIIICNKDMRTVPNMYILNLAICDIVHFTVLFSEACANRISDRWLDGDFICTSLPFCRRMSVVLSAYSFSVLYSCV